MLLEAIELFSNEDKDQETGRREVRDTRIKFAGQAWFETCNLLNTSIKCTCQHQLDCLYISLPMNAFSEWSTKG